MPARGASAGGGCAAACLQPADLLSDWAAEHALTACAFGPARSRDVGKSCMLGIVLAAPCRPPASCRKRRAAERRPWLGLIPPIPLVPLPQPLAEHFQF